METTARGSIGRFESTKRLNLLLAVTTPLQIARNLFLAVVSPLKAEGYAVTIKFKSMCESELQELMEKNRMNESTAKKKSICDTLL